MENCNKVCISLSGGLDSTCLLMHYLAKGFSVKAFSFDYGQKHDIELKKVKKNINFLQEKGFPVEYQCINLRDCFSDSASSLSKNSDEAIPEGDYRDDSMKSTVVENRNIIFSSIIYGKALSWSKRSDSNVLISLGIHAGDHTIYPDTTPKSQEMARELFRISNWGSERIDYEAPFVNINKTEVLRNGINSMMEMGLNKVEIRKVLKNTHSCYNPDKDGRSCGKCGTCNERLEAFAEIGIKDPVTYIK